MVDARRAPGVVAVACLLALTGCTSDGPAAPTPSPSPVVQTPTETSQERQQRLDYAAAEKSYRTFRAEFNRVLRAGGARKSTKVMRATSGGSYLKELTEVVIAYKGLKIRTEGRENILYVHDGGYAPNELRLEVCEDTRDLIDRNSKGRAEGGGELRRAQLLVRHTATGWKVWSGMGKKVSKCD